MTAVDKSMWTVAEVVVAAAVLMAIVTADQQTIATVAWVATVVTVFFVIDPMYVRRPVKRRSAWRPPTSSQG